MFTTVFTAVFTAVLMCVSIASANPFFVGRFDGLLGGPLDTRPFALYWNPANLDTKGTHIDLHIGLISRQASYDRVLPEDTPDIIKEINGGLGTTSSLGMLPSLAAQWGGVVNGIRVGAGGGVYIARAGTSNWDRHPEAPAEYPGAYDGPQRWSVLSTSMVLIDYALGTSVGWGPISLGVALNYVQATLSTSKASNVDNSDDVVDSDGALKEGRIFLDDATGDDLHLTAGGRLELSDFTFGLSWRQAVNYQLEGKSYILFGSIETDAQAGVDLQVAHSFLGSVGWRANNMLTLRVEVEQQGWSIMDQQTIINLEGGEKLKTLQRNFKDTMAYRLRSDLMLSKRFTLHLGLSFEEGATPKDFHESGLAENDQIEGGIGVTWSFSPHLNVHSTFFWQQFFDQEVTQSIQAPSTNGKYTDRRQYLTFNLQWTL